MNTFFYLEQQIILSQFIVFYTDTNNKFYEHFLNLKCIA